MRRSAAVVSAMSVVFAALVGVTPAGSAEWPGGDCAEVQYVVVRGSGEPPAASVEEDDYDAENQWGMGDVGAAAVSRLTSDGRYASTTEGWRGVVYPALDVSWIVRDFGKFKRSITQGADGLLRELAAFESSGCATTSDVVIIGYSQGALAVRRALSGADLDPGTLDQISQVLLFGDPAYSSTEEIVRWKRPLLPRWGMVWADALDVNGLRRPFPDSLVGRVSSYCVKGDVVCRTSELLLDLVDRRRLVKRILANIGPHLSYAADADALAHAADMTTPGVTDPWEGRWSGAVDQPGSDPYSIDVTIVRGGPDRIGATVHYPGLGCSGTWTLDRIKPPYFFLTEQITSDPEATCVEFVPIRLGLRQDGRMGIRFGEPSEFGTVVDRAP